VNGLLSHMKLKSVVVFIGVVFDATILIDGPLDGAAATAPVRANRTIIVAPSSNRAFFRDIILASRTKLWLFLLRPEIGTNRYKYAHFQAQ
jgi:hypothetical protein